MLHGLKLVVDVQLSNIVQQGMPGYAKYANRVKHNKDWLWVRGKHTQIGDN